MLKFEQIASELITIRDFIRWATSQFLKEKLFYGHGIADALSEAVYLVLYALYLPYNLDTDYFDTRLTTSEKKDIFNILIKRIEKRIPASYITHEAWFAGLSFYVDERVLIPRSSLAEIIEEELQPWVNPEKVERILDLATGSGCIAIACADRFPQAQVDATDISENALAVARINVLRHNIEEQVSLIQSDLYQNLSDQIYDVIISNPPYVPLSEMEDLPKEYTYEPRLGLEAGQEGLDCVIPILKQASHYLSDEGVLIVEVGNSKEALIKTFPDLPFTWLEFERGEEGVFLLHKQDLLESNIND